uniref:Uncharacterized protein n=1 Tax=Romanomermis culicivorax TaxID=13658 RepID=A0A915IF13_ROMCU
MLPRPSRYLDCPVTSTVPLPRLSYEIPVTSTNASLKKTVIINEQTIIVTPQLKYDPPSLLDLNLPLVTPDTPPRATIIESTTSTIAIIMAPLWTWTMPQQHL